MYFSCAVEPLLSATSPFLLPPHSYSPPSPPSSPSPLFSFMAPRLGFLSTWHYSERCVVATSRFFPPPVEGENRKIFLDLSSSS